MKILEDRNINKLYYIIIQHPSRDHVVCPNKVEANIIVNIKDNAESKLNAVFFTEESEALYFANSINTTCPIKVVELSQKLFSKVEKVGLVCVDNLINNYVDCYLVNNEAYKIL